MVTPQPTEVRVLRRIEKKEVPLEARVPTLPNANKRMPLSRRAGISEGKGTDAARVAT
eukprot:CAMPEP_0116840062 /NCGR_PEP_ID=MMETSP0418-20121206/10125_1 /TAXON_ID=1158023 /ORGANISM="Astrosyne radiata, Strain 13vi08-1A" /LENGTH=57 /DNA_ID=CAMNT_0004470265 /DNA_START=164 /DNA_END=337 /DNA_ORIENTATION=-